MDIAKALGKIPDKDRQRIKKVLTLLVDGAWSGLDIKKLKGFPNLFRLRVGAYRLIYEMGSRSNVTILKLERRNDTTYD